MSPKRQQKGRREEQQQLIDLPPAGLDCFEKALFKEGFRYIAGVDEAGRGSLAGPVVAAAVILPENLFIDGLIDSKQLTKPERDHFFDVITRGATSVGVGVIEHAEIDSINILSAALKAMSIAVDGLSKRPDYLLIDGPFAINMPIMQRAIKKGDALSISIAAASVIAKVGRDKIMCELEKSYPKFSFSVHKGYGTKLHLDELSRYGPTPVHRRTFRGVRGIQYDEKDIQIC